jgi:hypothetical protein
VVGDRSEHQQAGAGGSEHRHDGILMTRFLHYETLHVESAGTGNFLLPVRRMGALGALAVMCGGHRISLPETRAGTTRANCPGAGHNQTSGCWANPMLEHRAGDRLTSPHGTISIAPRRASVMSISSSAMPEPPASPPRRPIEVRA